LIQVIQREQIFDLNQSKVTLIRDENSSFLSFSLFPLEGKEKQVVGLSTIEVVATQSPERPVSASRATIDVRSTSPVSTQISARKSQTNLVGTAESLGSIVVQRPRLSNKRFAINKPGSTILLYQTNAGNDFSDILSQSSLLAFDSRSGMDGSQAAGTIERSLITKKCIPIKIELRDFTLDQQQLFITVKARVQGRVVSNQQLTVTDLEVLDQEQLDYKINCLGYTRIDAGNLQFTAYLNRSLPSSSVVFTSRTWSNSVSKSNLSRKLQRVDQTTKTATFSVLCTQNEYAEVIAQAFDGKNRPCGYPTRTLIRSRNPRSDIQSIVLKSLDSDGLTARVQGIPVGTGSIRVSRKNISNLSLPIEEVGVFSVADGSVDFKDDKIVESNYPNTRTSFEYEVLLITNGTQKKSDQVLRVDYGLIDNSYSFQTVFNESSGALSVQVSPEKPAEILDGLSRSLAEKSLTDAFADQIKEIRSQTAEVFLYDAYLVNLETSERTYLGEFSENRFSLPLSTNSVYYIYPKTATPRNQISAIKRLIEQPQLVSRSRASRVSPRNLAASLDSQVITEDGIKPKLFNPSGLIDGTLSTQYASLTSYPTGQVITYQSSSPREALRAGNFTCRRIHKERNLIQWSSPAASDVSHFLLKASTGEAARATFLLCILQKTQSSRYIFIDEVLGKSPGFIKYYLTPVNSRGIEQTTITVDLQPGEVEIG